MQEMDENGYPKMNAYLKHFTAYSREYQRQHQNDTVSTYDLWDTYLPQYEAAFTRGNASGVMCSYNGINGVPNCASPELLRDIMREKWSQPDALSMSDCGAVKDVGDDPWYEPTPEGVVARVVMGGNDIEAGSEIFNASAISAVQSGLLNASFVAEAVRRTLVQRFRVGLFDPPERVAWTQIPESALGAPDHSRLSYEAALQGMVLLRNERGALPIKAGSRIAVVGPHAMTRRELFSDYYGNEVCFNDQGKDNHTVTFACVHSIAEAISNANIGGVTNASQGVQFLGGDDGGLHSATPILRDADVIVMALGTVGLGLDIEHEGCDRSEISLPGHQLDFATEVIRLCKTLDKTCVLVLINGGPIAIDQLLRDQDRAPDSIVEAFFPATHGADAIAAHLFGRENRWGKLPYTVYPAAYTSQVYMDDFSMSKAPGRTHRYYQGPALFPFGYGLSYADFSLACSQTSDMESLPAQFECTVTNKASVPGEEVIMMFFKPSTALREQARHPVPLQNLVGFERVRVGAGGSATVTFVVGEEQLALTNEDGDKIVAPGDHEIVFTRGAGDDTPSFNVKC